MRSKTFYWWLIFLVLFGEQASQASFLRAKGLWPTLGLNKVAVYRGEKGEVLAFVAGSNGLYTVDVTDPYHPKKISFTDELPFPGQIQTLTLSLSGKKPKLLVADGSGGLCSFEVSNKGLKKPLCFEVEGTVYKAQELNGFLFVTNGQGLQLWDTSGKKEWSLIAKVDTPGQARSFYLYLPNPDLLEPPFDNIKDQTELQEIPLPIGTIYVADEWAGLQVLSLSKINVYDVPQKEGATPTLLKVTYRLSRKSSWKEGSVYAVAGAGPFLAVSLGKEVKIFQTKGYLQEIYTFSEAVDPYFEEAKDLFLKAFSDRRYFIFIAAARYGVKVLEINQEGRLWVDKVAESLIGPMVKGLFVDDKFYFYVADSQAGLSVGQLVDFVSPELTLECRGAPTAKLTLSNLGPFEGKPAFFCLWLEVPNCGETKGLANCKAKGLSEEEINWQEISYVLSDARAKFFEWLPGRHCYPVEKLEEIKDLPVLRAEHGFLCEELDGARLNFCLDLDVDWQPDLCVQKVF